MREIIIKRHPKPGNEDAEHIYMYCEFEDLKTYVMTAMRMRPDRITIEYKDYLKEK